MIDQDRVSPPTRGWTLLTDRVAELLYGFPAHAGMDPQTKPPLTSDPGFPRPRGDGPRSYQERFQARRVSPPTRGWTSPPG